DTTASRHSRSPLLGWDVRDGLRKTPNAPGDVLYRILSLTERIRLRWQQYASTCGHGTRVMRIDVTYPNSDRMTSFISARCSKLKCLGSSVTNGWADHHHEGVSKPELSTRNLIRRAVSKTFYEAERVAKPCDRLLEIVVAQIGSHCSWRGSVLHHPS